MCENSPAATNPTFTARFWECFWKRRFSHIRVRLCSLFLSYFASKGTLPPAGISVNPSAPPRLFFPYGNPIPAPAGQALTSLQNPPCSHWGWCWNLSGCFSESLGDGKCDVKVMELLLLLSSFSPGVDVHTAERGKASQGGLVQASKLSTRSRTGFIHTKAFFAQK